MWKPAKLDPEKSLYLAIADAIENAVGSGELKPGERLMPQRELADVVGVNLSTVTRAFKESERRGHLSGEVGRGTFVAADAGISLPLMRREFGAPELLELGLVLPLYASEGDMVAAVRETLTPKTILENLRYGDPEGSRVHREAGALWAKKFGLDVTSDDIIITAGSQHALACCLMAVFKPGDRVAVDVLTYPGFKSAAQMLGIRLDPIKMDGNGMLPQDLEITCRASSLKGIYLMPQMQNPTATRMDKERRHAITELIRRFGLILVEDDAYALFGEQLASAMSADLGDQAIFVGSISKVFAAGLRISFLSVPKRYRELVRASVLNTVWMASPINAAIAAQMIVSGRYEAIIRLKRKEARRRNQLARQLFASYRVRSQPNGFFVWLELPCGWTGREFELMAREAGVRVFCAERFAVGRATTTPAIRISLTGPENFETLVYGLKLLKGTILKGYQNRDPIM